MPFFQNLFTADYLGVFVLGDRGHSPNFKCPRNYGRSEELVTAFNHEPYDLSGNDSDGSATNTLLIYFSLNSGNWTLIAIDITASASSSAAVKSSEIVTALNNNSTFATFFIASVYYSDYVAYLQIRAKFPVTKFNFYIANGKAEEVLRFNARAGVAELPTYFARHTIANRFTYTDSQNLLIELDPGANNVDANIIDNAVDRNNVNMGYDSGTVQEDWELLSGKSGLFNFQKVTVDVSDRVTEIIEYAAGAGVGDFAKKTTYSYTGTNKNPSQITEIPYTLESGDLVTP